MTVYKHCSGICLHLVGSRSHLRTHLIRLNMNPRTVFPLVLARGCYNWASSVPLNLNTCPVHFLMTRSHCGCLKSVHVCWACFGVVCGRHQSIWCTCSVAAHSNSKKAFHRQHWLHSAEQWSALWHNHLIKTSTSRWPDLYIVVVGTKQMHSITKTANFQAIGKHFLVV